MSNLKNEPTSSNFTTRNGKKTPQILEVLRNGPFMLLFAAQFTQNVGAAVSWLALQFLLYDLTRSPGLMGLLSIVFWLPYVIFTPLAGVLVDRYDQRKIMLFSNLLSFITSIGIMMIYLFIDKLTLLEYLTTEITETGTTIIKFEVNSLHVIWPFFVLTFFNSTAASVFFPTRSAYTRLIVKKENLLIANSIGSTVFQIATIVGYVVAGLLASINYLYSFIFNSSTFAFSMTMIIFIILIGKKPPKVDRQIENTFRAQAKSIFTDLKIGFQTIRNTKKIAYMLIIFASTIFSFSAFNVLFIVILQGEMGLGEKWYGIMQSLMGISGIITSVIFMAIGKIRRKVAILNYAMIGATAFLFLFAFIRNPILIGVLLFFFGVALATINVNSPTLIQEQVPYEKQGRVFGTQQLFQGLARILGMGIVSIIAEYILPMYILFAAGGILAIIITWGFIYSSKKGLSGDDYLEKIKIESKLDDKLDLLNEEEKDLNLTKSIILDSALE
ncbi:MAG: MFS transporter [Candidatus Heimdallarchaeota archaeon]|nr:MFS transporter [Candidatus Heimdallarchaeota archaeon]